MTAIDTRSFVGSTDSSIDRLKVADELNALAEQAYLLHLAISGYGHSKRTHKEVWPLMDIADDISHRIRALSSQVWPTA